MDRVVPLATKGMRLEMHERKLGIGDAPPLCIGAIVEATPHAQPSVTWFVYRGDGAHVTFNPEQANVHPDYRDGSNSPWSPLWMPPPLPADGRFAVTATFKAPGTYVIRVTAHDGGLTSTQDVTVKAGP